MTKDEALRMAIDVLELYEERMNSSIAMEIIQACKEALAETQEPMTHVIGLDNDGKEVVVKLQTPLYTSPPSREWVGLSDDEIDIIAILQAPPVHPDFVEDDSWYDFTKAIEKVLREKNG